MKDTKNIINKYSFDRYELERNFDIEMEDETFKKLVSKLKLSKDELIKYTSRIKDASLELKNCTNCKNIMECKNNICGYVYYPSVLQDNLVFSYVPCKYKRKLDNDTKYQDNIISFDMDLFGWSRKKSTLVSLILIIILSMPCVMGFNVLVGFTPLGEGSTIMDLEDFIVSNNLLPLGSLGYVLFCTKKNGWGWNHFLEEINQGEGWKFPSGIKGYMSYGLPLLIIIIYLKGYYDKFQPMGTKVLIGWMIVAILFLTFVIGCSCGKSNAEKVDK